MLVLVLFFLPPGATRILKLTSSVLEIDMKFDEKYRVDFPEFDIDISGFTLKADPNVK